MIKTRTGVKKQKVKKDDKKLVEFNKWINSMIAEMIEKWLVIDFVNIETEYVDKSPKEIPNSMFAISYQKKYRKGVIYVYPNAFGLYKEKRISELTDGLLHELAHVYTIPVMILATNRYSSKDELENAFEELTEIMAHYMKKTITK